MRAEEKEVLEAALAYRKGSFTGARDTELFWQCWRSREPQGLLVVVHGLGEHSDRYQNVVEAMTGLPVSIWTFDLRGFGRSAGPRGHVETFFDYMEDLDRFLQLAEAEEGLLPIFLLGHSYGGLIALRYGLSRPGRVHGLILSAPALGLALPMPAWKRRLAPYLSRIWPRYSAPHGIDPTALSHDLAVVENVDRDPLMVNRVTVRLFSELLSSIELCRRRAVQLRVPCLMLLGGRDAVVSGPACHDIFQRLGSEDKELHVYSDLYHELFNEVGKEEPLEMLRLWVESKLPKVPR